jgi:hypothetical protein
MPRLPVHLLARIDPNEPDVAVLLQHICTAAAAELDVLGVGVMLMAFGEHHVTVAASDPMTWVWEDLQEATGEGPCLDAHRTGEVVLVPDIAAARDRWPRFATRALADGLAAVFSFPLGWPAARMGALDLYRERAGRLDAAGIDAGLALSELVTDGLLRGAAGRALLERVEAGDSTRWAVDQATGVTAAQLGVDVGEALQHLRDHAAAHARPLTAVAVDVVAGGLRVGPQGPTHS